MRSKGGRRWPGCAMWWCRTFIRGVAYSLLTHVDANGAPLPEQPAGTLSALALAPALGATVARPSDGVLPCPVLMGDALDMGLSRAGDTAQAFPRFVDALFPAGASPAFSADVLCIRATTITGSGSWCRITRFWRRWKRLGPSAWLPGTFPMRWPTHGARCGWTPAGARSGRQTVCRTRTCGAGDGPAVAGGRTLAGGLFRRSRPAGALRSLSGRRGAGIERDTAAIDLFKALLNEILRDDPDLLAPQFQFTETMEEFVSLADMRQQVAAAARISDDCTVAAACGRSAGTAMDVRLTIHTDNLNRMVRDPPSIGRPWGWIAPRCRRRR